LRGYVQGDRVGPLEALEQSEGAGTGSATQVKDPAGERIGSQVLDP
jgi:hypothetical protein